MDGFQTKLKKYPSSFDVLDNLPKSKEGVKKINDKLELELKSEEYDTDMQYHRAWNLISFLCFVLKDNAKAELYNDKVLKSDPNNMIALSNKAWFSIKECVFDQYITEYDKKLEELKQNNLILLVAKAEVAFTYSRLGVKRFDNAISSYKDVIDECDRLTRVEMKEASRVPVDYICVWLFGYALAQKRQLNFSTAVDENELDFSPESYRRVIELYCRIIGLTDSSELVKRYRARSYVDLGQIRYGIEDIFPSETPRIFTENQNLPKQEEEYFTTALDILPEDVYVLERSGKYFRYARQIERSIRMLTKAVKIKGSSYAYHHLASSLRRKLDIAVGNVLHQPLRSKGQYATNRTRQSIKPIKSPLNAKRINYEENKEAADEILRYFDQAVEISLNTGAMYDKGLFCRQLGNPVKALEIFEYLIKNEEGNCSLVEIANAYEQAGLCIRDMMRECIENDQYQVLEHKMKMYLKSSIEISCKIVANIPCLKKCWKSAPTLISILHGEADTQTNYEDLLFLYEKLKRHKDALEVLNELEKFAHSVDENIEILHKKIETYLILERYDDAVLALDMVILLPKGLDKIGKRLCQQVYVEAGMDALKNGNDGIARARIHSSFKLMTRNNSDETHSSPDDGSDDEKYDLLILSNIDEEDKGRQLLSIMNQIGLHTTLNIDSELPGTPILTGIISVMKKCEHFVTVFDFDDGESVARKMQYFTQLLQTIVEGRKRGSSNRILIKAVPCDKVPDIYFGYKVIDMDFSTVHADFTKSVHVCETVKELLLALTFSS
ncbi:uncharacterized protein LOC123559160 [Mercenaria mercenaria]|uniref:uncharacterized protein LOC123559160 n=1 Tax=Mercenaria mercenaria TaxID=6596 RepID=UPI00234F44AD|nr:uncharacterized protein LOC123559160 [Mercenaria mercenaria]